VALYCRLRINGYLFIVAISDTSIFIFYIVVKQMYCKIVSYNHVVQ